MRVAYTIILNGKHHLERGDFVKTMLDTFDLWAIVEGVALPNGSTKWCKKLPAGMVTQDGLSTDGTSEAILDIWTENPNVEYVTPPAGSWWQSKDDMVNAACKVLAQFCSANNARESFLWQVDVDEQWTPENIFMAEAELIKQKGRCGMFCAVA